LRERPSIDHFDLYQLDSSGKLESLDEITTTRGRG